MITRRQLDKAWKRTIGHWLFSCLIAIGIVLYLLLVNGDTGNLTPLAAVGVVVVIIAATVSFIIVSRAIRNTVGARFGQRENRK
jgi:cell division protein FtsW (lipid II flippase)